MNATMSDVAKRAGVSKATVSYVLNGRGTTMRIADDTRKRILMAMRELDYHPNAVARSLTQKKTNAIAVVMQYPALFSGASGFTNALMHGATDAAIRCRYDVMLHTCPSDDENAPPETLLEREVATLTDGRVDGALLLRDADDPLAEMLCERAFPNVLMFTRNDRPDQWYVDCDNVRGAELAVEYLFQLGHRKIVHLVGNPASRAARDRLQGYLGAMRRAGVEPPAEWQIQLPAPDCDFTPIVTLLKGPEALRPTAFFSWSDDVAIQALRTVRSINLKVPEDISIIGYDSTQMCEYTDPPMTSIRQPIYEMAESAFSLLASQIAGEPVEQKQLIFQPELTLRRSCQQVKGSILEAP